MSKEQIINAKYLENKIYIIRGQKVMLDSDLAEIYGYTTKAFNQQIQRNIEKFDEDFMFRVDENDLVNLRSQIATSRLDLDQKEESSIRSQFVTGWYPLKEDDIRCKNSTGSHRNSRFRPYVFTEQGIYMLMTVLKGDLAVKQSKALIRLFKTMKDYIYDNNGYFPYKELDIRTTKLEKNVESIKCDLDKVMDNFVDENTYKHFLIMNGRKIEADCAYMKIFKSAKRSIYYIDNYTNLKTLELLSNVNNNVEILLFTNISKTSIKEYMIKDFSIQNPSNTINVKDTSNKYHDRYIIVDYGLKSETIYHCGASCKDGGNKISSIVKIDEFGLYKPMIKKLLKMPNIKLK